MSLGTLLLRIAAWAVVLFLVAVVAAAIAAVVAGKAETGWRGDLRRWLQRMSYPSDKP